MSTTQRDWRHFALLLIDVQQDFWTADRAQSFPDFPNHTAELVALCRAEGIEIIHLRASFQPDMSDWMIRYKLFGRIPCIEGTAGITTLPCAQEAPDEVVLRKQSFDGFHNPQLRQLLQERGKRFVLVAGLITSTCVLFTATAAAQQGFLVTLVEDCCADEPTAHAHTLQRYRFIFDRVTVDQIVDSHAEWQEALAHLETLY